MKITNLYNNFIEQNFMQEKGHKRFLGKAPIGNSLFTIKNPPNYSLKSQMISYLDGEKNPTIKHEKFQKKNDHSKKEKRKLLHLNFGYRPESFKQTNVFGSTRLPLNRLSLYCLPCINITATHNPKQKNLIPVPAKLVQGENESCVFYVSNIVKGLSLFPQGYVSVILFNSYTGLASTGSTSKVIGSQFSLVRLRGIKTELCRTLSGVKLATKALQTPQDERSPLHTYKEITLKSIYFTSLYYFAKSINLLHKVRIFQNWFFPSFITNLYIADRYKLQKQSQKYKIPVRNTCKLFIIYIFGSFCWLYFVSSYTRKDKNSISLSPSEAQDGNLSLFKEVVVSNLPLFQKNSSYYSQETVENITLKKQTFMGLVKTGKKPRAESLHNFEKLAPPCALSQLRKDLMNHEDKQISLFFRENSIQNYIGRAWPRKNLLEKHITSEFLKTPINQTQLPTATTVSFSLADSQTSSVASPILNKKNSEQEARIKHSEAQKLGFPQLIADSRESKHSRKTNNKELLFYSRKSLCLGKLFKKTRLLKNKQIYGDYYNFSLFLGPEFDLLPRLVEKLEPTVDRHTLFNPNSLSKQTQPLFYVNFKPKMTLTEDLNFCSYSYSGSFLFNPTQVTKNISLKTPFLRKQNVLTLPTHYLKTKTKSCFNTLVSDKRSKQEIIEQSSMPCKAQANKKKTQATLGKIVTMETVPEEKPFESFTNTQEKYVSLSLSLSLEHSVHRNRTNFFTNQAHGISQSRSQSGFNFPDATLINPHSLLWASPLRKGSLTFSYPRSLITLTSDSKYSSAHFVRARGDKRSKQVKKTKNSSTEFLQDRSNLASRVISHGNSKHSVARASSSVNKNIFLTTINPLRPTASTSSCYNFVLEKQPLWVKNNYISKTKTKTRATFQRNNSQVSLINKDPVFELVYKKIPQQGYIFYNQHGGHIKVQTTSRFWGSSKRTYPFITRDKYGDILLQKRYEKIQNPEKGIFYIGESFPKETNSNLKDQECFSDFYIPLNNQNVSLGRLPVVSNKKAYTYKDSESLKQGIYNPQEGHAPESFFGMPYLPIGESFTLEHIKGKSQMGRIKSVHGVASKKLSTLPAEENVALFKKPILPYASKGTSALTVFGKKPLITTSYSRAKKVQNPVTNRRLVSQWNVSDFSLAQTLALKDRFSKKYLFDKTLTGLSALTDKEITLKSKVISAENLSFKKKVLTNLLSQKEYFRINGKTNRNIINPFKYYNPGTKRDRNIEDTMLILEGYKKSRLFPKIHMAYQGINVGFLPESFQVLQSYPKHISKDCDLVLYDPPLQSILGGMRQRTESQRIAQNVTGAPTSSSEETRKSKNQKIEQNHTNGDIVPTLYSQQESSFNGSAKDTRSTKNQSRKNYSFTNCYPLRTLLTIRSLGPLSLDFYPSLLGENKHFNTQLNAKVTSAPHIALSLSTESFTNQPLSFSELLHLTNPQGSKQVQNFSRVFALENKVEPLHCLGKNLFKVKPTDRTEYIFSRYQVKNSAKIGKPNKVYGLQNENYFPVLNLAKLRGVSKSSAYPLEINKAKTTEKREASKEQSMAKNFGSKIKKLTQRFYFKPYGSHIIFSTHTTSVEKGLSETVGFYFEKIFSPRFRIGYAQPYLFSDSHKTKSIFSSEKDKNGGHLSGVREKVQSAGLLLNTKSRDTTLLMNLSKTQKSNSEVEQLLKTQTSIEIKASLLRLIIEKLWVCCERGGFSFSKIIFFIAVWSSYKTLAKALIGPDRASQSTQFLPAYFTEAIGLQSFQQKYRIITPTKTKHSFKNLAGAEKNLAELRDLIWTFAKVGTGTNFSLAPKRLSVLAKDSFSQENSFNPLPYFGRSGQKTGSGSLRVSVQSKTRNRLLLVGPPGTGKTLLVKTLAAEANVPVIVQPVSQLRMITGVENPISALFHVARQIKPCIIFLDELDTLGNNLNTSTTETTAEQKLGIRLARKYTYSLLLELDGLTSSTQDLLIIGATNRPETLNPALTRSGRFETFINCNLPSQEQRIAVLALYLSNYKILTHLINFKKEDKLKHSGLVARNRLRVPVNDHFYMNYVANQCSGLSQASIGAIVNQSALQSIFCFAQGNTKTNSLRNDWVIKKPLPLKENTLSVSSDTLKDSLSLSTILVSNTAKLRYSQDIKLRKGRVVKQGKSMVNHRQNGVHSSSATLHTLQSLEQAIQSVKTLTSKNFLGASTSFPTLGKIEPLLPSDFPKNNSFLSPGSLTTIALGRLIPGNKTGTQQDLNQKQKSFSLGKNKSLDFIRTQNLQFFVYQAYQAASSFVIRAKLTKSNYCFSFFKNHAVNVSYSWYSSSRCSAKSQSSVKFVNQTTQSFPPNLPDYLKLSIGNKGSVEQTQVQLRTTSTIFYGLEAFAFQKQPLDKQSIEEDILQGYAIKASISLYGATRPQNLQLSNTFGQKNSTKTKGLIETNFAILKQLCCYTKTNSLGDPLESHSNYSASPAQLDKTYNPLAHIVKTSKPLTTGWFRVYLSRPIIRYDKLAYIENKEYYPQNNYVLQQCFAKGRGARKVSTLAHLSQDFQLQNKKVWRKPNAMQNQDLHGVVGKLSEPKPFLKVWTYLTIVAYSFHKASLFFQNNRELLDYCVYNKLRYNVLYDFSVNSTCYKF